jgi:hypothetical protein
MASEGQQPGEMNAQEVRALERELRALVPRSPRIDVAKVMFLAGQASLSPVPPIAPTAPTPSWHSQWLWPAATAVSSVAAAWLAVLLVLSHNKESLPNPEPRTVAQPDHPAPTTNPLSPSPTSQQAVAQSAPAPAVTVNAADAHYLNARKTAIQQGVEALPEPTTDRSSPVEVSSYREMKAHTFGREPRGKRTVTGSWSNWFGQ